MILVVDDDPAIRDSLSKRAARRRLHDATAAATASKACSAFQSHAPDLVLTDLSMPRSDGFELIAAIRATSRVRRSSSSPSAATIADKIRALDLGADDFVTKPFSVAELLARVRAQLRRTGARPSTTLAFDDLTIDLERRRVVQGGRDIRLTPTEFSLLELLATNAGKPMFIEQIIARVWRDAPGTTRRHRARHMSSLRKKIEPDPSIAALHRDRAVGRLSVHRRAGLSTSLGTL